MKKTILIIILLVMGSYVFSKVGAVPMPGAFGVPLSSKNYQGGNFDKQENAPTTYDEKEIIALIGNYNVAVGQQDKAAFTISISNASGLYFVSQSNPAFKRPFEIQLSFSANYDGGEHLRFKNIILNENNPETTVSIKQIFDANKIDIDSGTNKYAIWCDIVLILPGEVDTNTDLLVVENGGVETSYPLVPANDYTAMVTISYEYKDGESSNTESGVITVPFAGYYDRLSTEIKDDTVNMYVNPNANAARLSIERDNSTWIDIGTVEMRSIYYKIKDTGGTVGTNNSPKIFASSSRNPFALNPDKFILLHDSVTVNTPVNSMNSIGYKVRLSSLSDNSHVEFDGTDSVKPAMTSDEINNANWISVKSIKVDNNLEAKYNEYNLYTYSGRIEVMIDDPGSIVMAPGRYTGNVYLHLVMEE